VVVVHYFFGLIITRSYVTDEINSYCNNCLSMLFGIGLAVVDYVTCCTGEKIAINPRDGVNNYYLPVFNYTVHSVLCHILFACARPAPDF